jgi:hypothetical protein
VNKAKMIDETPKEPKWFPVYELMRARDHGDIITLKELGFALGVDPTDYEDRAYIRLMVAAAKRRYLKHDNRTVHAVPNKGYRVADAIEHLDLSRDKQRRAKREMERAHDLVVYVDTGNADQTMIVMFRDEAMNYRRQLEFMSRETKKQQRTKDIRKMLGYE